MKLDLQNLPKAPSRYRRQSKIDPEILKSRIMGNYLRDCRINKGLSLAAAAKAIGVPSFRTLWNIENEVSYVPIRYIKKMSRVYGVPDLDIRQHIVGHRIRMIKKKYGLD